MAQPEPGAQRPGAGGMGCQGEKGRRRLPEKQQQEEVAGSSKNLPFLGKSFYLDLPNNKNVQFLMVMIKQLGGVIESFLSKEVSYVVSSSKEAKLDSRPRRQTEKRTSTASGDARAKTLPAAVPKGTYAGPLHKPADCALISRGKELLQKAIRKQDSSSGSILAKARSWGVRILNVDEMMAYVQHLQHSVSRARKQREMTMVKCSSVGAGVLKVGRLKPPFLKIEDQSRRFRPFHHQFRSFPDLNFLAPNRSSPFEPLKSPSSSCRVRAPEGCLTHSERERSPKSDPATVPKRRKGFCECCRETFEELQTHLQSPQHRQFALDSSQYAAVDHIISQLTNDFAALPAWSSPTRASCSPATSDERDSSQKKAVQGVSAPTAGLGRKHQLAMKDNLELHPSAVAGLGLPGGEHSTCSSETLKVSRLPPATQLPAGAPLLGLQDGPSAGAGPIEMVHAGLQGTDSSAFCHDAAGATATGHSLWTHASNGASGAAACSPELPQNALRPPGVSPCTRKRRLSCSPSPWQKKKPRILLGSDPLCQEKRMSSVPCSLFQGNMGLMVGGTVGTGPSEDPRTEFLQRPAKVCSSLTSVTPQDHDQDLPAPPGVIDEPEAAQARWGSGTPGLQEKQPVVKGLEAPGCVAGSSLELLSPVWNKTSCPAAQHHLPVLRSITTSTAQHCCCSPCFCTGAAGGAQPEPPDTTDLYLSLVPHPRNLQPVPNLSSSSSSLESDWDVQLLPSLDTLHGPSNRPVDPAVLQRTCIDIRDSGYTSHLYSVLKQKSELDWPGRDDKSCRKCCTETEGAPLAVLEACRGTRTS